MSDEESYDAYNIIAVIGTVGLLFMLVSVLTSMNSFLYVGAIIAASAAILGIMLQFNLVNHFIDKI